MQKVNTASLDQLFTGAKISGANGNARKLSGTSDDFQSVMSGTSARSQTVEQVQKTEGRNPSQEKEPMNASADQMTGSVTQPSPDRAAGDAADGDVTAVQQMTGETEKLVETVKEAVQDILEIDEDVMEAVMAEMGITVVQLLDPSVLQKFIMTVHGSGDVMEFLTGEDMMNDFSELLQMMQDLTGVDREELPQLADVLMQDMQNTEQLDTSVLEEEFTQIPVADAEGQEEQIPVAEGQNISSGTQGEQDAPLMQEQQETEPVQVSQTAKEVLENQPDTILVKDAVHSGDEKMGESTEEPSDDTAKILTVSGEGQKTADGNQSGQNQSQDSQMMQQPQLGWESRETVIRREPTDSQPITMTQFVENMMQSVSGEQGTQPVNPVQMFQIVNQVVEQIRTHMQDGETTMEMQLNPESLGKVLLSVTNKDGVMTASFTVQTTEAKEALESQMQVLRENLEQKNLKVDAVEVSVSDFSFSQSSMADDQKNFNQGNGKAHRFRFEEEEEEDAAAEAEQVRESVMRDSGSSIDFTA